jgi:hypothetical protein
MRCDKAEPLLTRLQDGELDRWTAGRVRRHLDACPGCRAAYREIEALGAAARAWRDVTAPPALKARISTALAAAPRAEEIEPAAIVSSRRRAVHRKEWFTMPIVRWGLIGVTAAGLALLWTGSQRGDVALAAVIRAAEAVHAVHFVGEGSQGTQVEGWWVDGVGSVMRWQHGRSETLDVDDRKHRYVYTVSERPVATPKPQGPDQGQQTALSGTLQRRVDVGPSALADPREQQATREQFNYAGVLKQLERQHSPREIQGGWAVLNGRRLRRITARGESQVLYVDSQTDRLVMLEDWGGPGTRGEALRVQISYPDPSAVDRRLFQFHVPRGVPVHQIPPGSSAGPQPPKARNAQEKLWLQQQRLLNGCLQQMFEVREALRRYANDHCGEWPPALIPYLDPYVKDREVFHCPADHGTGQTSYVYHRLTGAQAAAALKAMNETAPTSSTPPRRDTPVLLDCPHHPRWTWHIDARGDTFGNGPPVVKR